MPCYFFPAHGYAVKIQVFSPIFIFDAQNTGRYTSQPPFTEAEPKGILSLKGEGILRANQQFTGAGVVFSSAFSGTVDNLPTSSSESGNSTT